MSSPPPHINGPPLSAGMSGSIGGGTSNEQQIRLQILASLFPPGSQHGSYIAHLKTWEDVPGAPPGAAESKKPRYILLAVTSDGRIKLHKSKRNMNGTFSIGKTWNFEDLKALEVHKPRRSAGGSTLAVPCFTITLSSKSYLWETESARQQDDFLITIVRSFRQYQNGAQPRLIGFQVGEIPGAPPAYEVPVQAGGMATPTSANRLGGSLPTPGIPRPGTAQSVMSNGSSRYAEGVPPHVVAHGSQGPGPSASYPDLSMAQQQQPSMPPMARRPSAASVNDASRNRQPSGSMPTFSSPFNNEQQLPPARTPSPAGLALRKEASSGHLAAQSGSTSSRPPLPVPQAVSPRLPQPQLPPANAPISNRLPNTSSSRSATPTRQLVSPADQISPRRGSGATTLRNASVSQDPKTPNTASTLDESTAAAKAAALLGQDSNAASGDDNDIMLTNVEEMLEGLEWGAGGQGRTADQLEKRLLGELHALEAAGIHAIIESDDRVNDVVRYLDNALAELDKMDQMISLYKTHLNAVSDDIGHIESQHQGLQLQSSNQRALLAELDRQLPK